MAEHGLLDVILDCTSCWIAKICLKYYWKKKKLLALSSKFLVVTCWMKEARNKISDTDTAKAKESWSLAFLFTINGEIKTNITNNRLEPLTFLQKYL